MQGALYNLIFVTNSSCISAGLATQAAIYN